MLLFIYVIINGVANDMSRDMTTQQIECAPSEDSDQPGHPPSLIRVFGVRMKNAWVLCYPLRLI